ncbi:hypothetical protein U746_2236 [Mycolicibacterium mucogenicum 261Sha1.1M5]|nr:hypothetical protein U746_2236 [Mycolicibacterium mucogenicum 261Sha1.1M5]
MTRDRPVPGRTVITARALERLAVGAARGAEAWRDATASPRAVGVKLADDAGDLRASVHIDLTLGHASEPLLPLGDAVRAAMIAQLSALGGRSVSRVDVRFSAGGRATERRVA